MTKTILHFLTLTLFTVLLSACDSKTEVKVSKAAESITIINPYIRELPPGQKVTAMYMELKNSSATNHDLVKVEGDISPMIELHTHTMNNGVMSMGQVDSMPVPANSSVKAQPGSYHVMIMGLSSDPKNGDNFNFTLTFKDGTSIPVTAVVKTTETL